jgi:hypothetical protein
MIFFTEMEKNPEIHVKIRKTPHNQRNPEQKRAIMAL